VSTTTQPATEPHKTRRSRARHERQALPLDAAKPLRWWQRLRSAFFLTVLAGFLGVLLAAVVGTLVVVAVLTIKHTLG
jgi:hypothetical protein